MTFSRKIELKTAFYAVHFKNFFSVLMFLKSLLMNNTHILLAIFFCNEIDI